MFAGSLTTDESSFGGLITSCCDAAVAPASPQCMNSNMKSWKVNLCPEQRSICLKQASARKTQCKDSTEEVPSADCPSPAIRTSMVRTTYETPGGKHFSAWRTQVQAWRFLLRTPLHAKLFTAKICRHKK